MATKKPAGTLRVSRLIVHGVLGVDDSTIDLDTVTLLQGRNGSGKSTHLKALRSALGIDRTSLARLARVSDEEGAAEAASVEVILVGDDREVRVTKKGSGSAEVAERVGDDWRAVKRPVEWLRDLIDVQAANPALWLVADDEARATAVLEAMPLEGYDRAAAMAAAGIPRFPLPRMPEDLHPLEELQLIEDAVFDARTVVHRQERTEHDAATKLLEGLPAAPPADVDAELARLEKQAADEAADVAREDERANADERKAVQAAASAHALAEERVRGTFKAEAAKRRKVLAERETAIRAEAEQKIAALTAETNAAVDALKARAEEELSIADHEKESAATAAREARVEARLKSDQRKLDVAKLREQLGGLRARKQSIETDRHVRATAAEGEAKAREHHAKAQTLTAAIEALKRYRLELAEKLPIKGLSVKFDEKGRKSLTLDGVPLSQVNDARLYELATEVSLLRSSTAKPGAPSLPLVLLDGIERLDPKARAALLREVASRGAQVIAAVVGPDALRVLHGEAAVSGDAAVP